MHIFNAIIYGLCYYLILPVSDVSGQTSILEAFLGPFRIFRKNLERLANIDLMSDSNQRLLRSRNKSQQVFSQQFPCNTNGTRSKTRPKSVHMLRPGDIDIIGALGDSLTVGIGVFANSVPQVVFESRGASFITGGDGSWRQHLTLANIFKEFNPNLYGYSSGNSFSINPQSGFNVAEAGAISDNIPYMVKILVKRIKSNPRVNINKDWKLINLLIGSNDFCSEMCYYGSYDNLLKKHRNEMLYVLRYLRDNLSRTLVNLIPVVNPILLRLMRRKPTSCYFTHHLLCPCIFGALPQNRLKNYHKTANRWQEIDMEMGELEEFQREDFAVVIQPVTINMTLPMKDGTVDMSYFSADCFHFSQKGYASFTNMIWNSMVTPVGQKKRKNNYKLLDEFICPSEEHPYIFTKMNSNV